MASSTFGQRFSSSTGSDLRAFRKVSRWQSGLLSNHFSNIARKQSPTLLAVKELLCELLSYLGNWLEDSHLKSISCMTHTRSHTVVGVLLVQYLTTVVSPHSGTLMGLRHSGSIPFYLLSVYVSHCIAQLSLTVYHCSFLVLRFPLFYSPSLE